MQLREDGRLVLLLKIAEEMRREFSFSDPNVFWGKSWEEVEHV